MTRLYQFRRLAWAGNTPFHQNASLHLGGTRPMAAFWPSHTADASGIRYQFEDIIDIATTHLKAKAGLPQPT